MSLVVRATPAVVWADLADIRTHVEWMADAEQIRFTTMQRHGVGAAFDCITKIGPIRLVDKMTCTEWIPGRVIGIRHDGIVTGTGRLELTPDPAGTLVSWTEALRFPWYFAGPLGAALGGRVVLRRLWRANLRRFSQRFSAL